MNYARQPHAVLDRGSRLLKAEKIVAQLEARATLRGARVLDIGCGAGYLATLLGARVGAEGSVHAVDTRDLRQSTDGFEFRLVEDTSLPFASETFDLAISNHVIEHVGGRPDQRRHLAEIARVLRPGGACYLALPNSRFPFERHFRLPLLSWLPRRLRSPYVRLMRRGERYDCDIPSPRTVRALAAGAGLSLEELTFDGVAHFRRVERPRGVLALLLQLPEPLLRTAMWISPSKMYLLTKAVQGSKDRDQTASGHRVHLIGPAPTARGGIAQFQAELARVLQDGGGHTTILAFRRVYPSFSRAGRQGADPSRRRSHVRHHSLLVPWLPWTWQRAATAIRDEQSDTVVIQWWHPITALCCRYVARRARKAGARVVFVCHNAFPHEPFPLARRLARLALAESSSLLALSPGVAAGLRHLLPDRDVTVIPLPAFSVLESDAKALAQSAESWRKRLGVGMDDKIVLFFGNVRPYKGLGDLIEVFPKVRERIPATLVVAGTFFEPVAEFRRRIDELGISSCVRLIDEYIANEDVAGLFAVATLVVLPYRSASQSGVLPLAAMLKTPVVATAVGGLEEALEGTGVVVPPNDRDALAAAIVTALETPPSPPPLATDLWTRWREGVFDEGARASEQALDGC